MRCNNICLKCLQNLFYLGFVCCWNVSPPPQKKKKLCNLKKCAEYKTLFTALLLLFWLNWCCIEYCSRTTCWAIFTSRPPNSSLSMKIPVYVDQNKISAYMSMVSRVWKMVYAPVAVCWLSKNWVQPWWFYCVLYSQLDCINNEIQWPQKVWPRLPPFQWQGVD